MDALESYLNGKETLFSIEYRLLTKVGAYRWFFIVEHLMIEIVNANSNCTPLSIALFDIDDFKAVNDKYGHIYGD